MKKILLLCVSLLVVLGIMGCGSDKGKAEVKPDTTSKVTTDTSAPAAKSKILVAYFSATGNSKQLAENTAKALGADLYEIRPAKPYSKDDLNYNDETIIGSLVNCSPKMPVRQKSIAGLRHLDFKNE